MCCRNSIRKIKSPRSLCLQCRLVSHRGMTVETVEIPPQVFSDKRYLQHKEVMGLKKQKVDRISTALCLVKQFPFRELRKKVENREKSQWSVFFVKKSPQISKGF